jgi:hypothetical protein
MTMPSHGGKPVALADHQATPVAVAVDAGGDRLYWSSFGQSEIRTRVLGATGSVETFAEEQDSAWDVVARNGVVYWTSDQHGTLSSAPADGGAAVVLATAVDASGLAVDDAHAYWSDAVTGTILATPVGGGDTVVLASGQALPSEVARDAHNVYWTNCVPGGAVMRLAR